MYIYWREWDKPPMNRDEARKLADEFRALLRRIVEERRELERIAKRIDRTLG